jgi:uncharacterized protein CbrC (UPF0167 family)
MDLPSFAYHPDPVASGSITASDATCQCCERARGFIYVGPVYAEDDLEDALCPWCIADGSAHEKFGASFTDEAGFPDEIDEEVIEEIAFRTPGFATWQEGRWLTCCDDAAAFLEPIGWTEIQERYPYTLGTLMTYIVQVLEISGGAATRLVKTLDRDSSPTAYVFQCLHCDSQPVYLDHL